MNGIEKIPYRGFMIEKDQFQTSYKLHDHNGAYCQTSWSIDELKGTVDRVIQSDIDRAIEERGMTKLEAIDAMRAGKKVQHKYFSPDEWMTMEGNEILLEDGVRCSEDEFWSHRTDPMFNDGYNLL
jgi:hypothetical protein